MRTYMDGLMGYVVKELFQYSWNGSRELLIFLKKRQKYT